MWKKNLPLTSLNHISLLCSSVEKSAEFYEDVLGFIPIKRPGSFNFDGAWLFNYGLGIHLIESKNEDLIPKKAEINPRDNHISFQCEDLKQVEGILEDIGIKYIKRDVEEGGIRVEQLFFHDPDGFMIEVCNCDNLPVIPLEPSLGVACSMRPPSSSSSSAQAQCAPKHATPSSSIQHKLPETFQAWGGLEDYATCK